MGQRTLLDARATNLTFLAAFWQVGRVIVAFNIKIRVETSSERQGFAFSRSLGFFLTGRTEDVLLYFIKMLLGNSLGQRFKALTDNRGINSKAVFVFLHLVNQEERSSPVITT